MFWGVASHPRRPRSLSNQFSDAVTPEMVRVLALEGTVNGQVTVTIINVKLL